MQSLRFEEFEKLDYENYKNSKRIKAEQLT